MKYVRFSYWVTQTMERAIVNRVSRWCQFAFRRALAKRCRCLTLCKTSHSTRNKLEFSTQSDHTSSTPFNFNKALTGIVKSQSNYWCTSVRMLYSCHIAEALFSCIRRCRWLWKVPRHWSHIWLHASSRTITHRTYASTIVCCCCRYKWINYTIHATRETE